MRTAAVVALLVAAQLAVGALAQESRCSTDSCFVQARAPDSCCLLNYPEIATVAEDATFAESATALTALVNAVCTPECFSPIFMNYRSCLLDADVAVEQANTFLPEGLCELTCVIDGMGVSLASLSNCTTLRRVPQECKESIVGIEGPIGENILGLFSACDIDIFVSEGGDVTFAGAPALAPMESAEAPMESAEAPMGAAKDDVTMAPGMAPAMAPLGMAPADEDEVIAAIEKELKEEQEIEMPAAPANAAASSAAGVLASAAMGAAVLAALVL